MESLNHVARSVWAHSSLFSHAVQDGELTPIIGVVLCTDCGSLRYVADIEPPPDGTRMFPRLLQKMHP